MKRTVIIAAALILGIAPGPPPAPAQIHVSISFGDFYTSLGPYGEWVYVDDGVYAWRPARIVHGWMPYAYGRWVWSAYGWYWVSDEPWSWAVYHYGRWHYDDWYGWVWVPGYDWAPAWVEWRYGPDYVGWAPLGPYALWSPHRGVYYSQAVRAPYNHWTFVDHRSMTRPDVYRHRYRGDDVRRVYGASRYTGSVRYRNGVVETRGPEREYVERRGNIRVGTADVVDVDDYSRVRSTRQDGRERIEVYRPQVARTPADRAVRPEKITRTERAPSIDSRYLDQRMRPDANAGPEPAVAPRDRPRPDTDVRSRERHRTEPQMTPVDPQRPVPGVKDQEPRQRPRQDVGSSVPRKPPARESPPAVKEPRKQTQPAPQAPQTAPRPEPGPRGRQ
jgi:hypothetical protein